MEEKKNIPTVEGEAITPEAPAADIPGTDAPSPDLTAGAPPQEQAGVTVSEPGDVVVSFDKIEELTAERAELASGVDNEHPALVAFMKYQNIECLTRDILVELVDHIKVYENGNISVRFKFADELRKIVEYIELNTEPRTQVV